MKSKVHAEVLDFARKLSAHLKPQTTAYHEIWLDKKQVAGEANVDIEPLYGETYLPRKFKVGWCLFFFFFFFFFLRNGDC